MTARLLRAILLLVRQMLQERAAFPPIGHRYGYMPFRPIQLFKWRKPNSTGVFTDGKERIGNTVLSKLGISEFASITIRLDTTGALIMTIFVLWIDNRYPSGELK